MTKKKASKKKTTHGAVLVNLSVRQFGNEKTDASIVQEVAKSHNATFSKDRYLKQILPPAVMGKIKNQISTIRAYHYRVTAPWFDRGIRMMAAGFIIPYQEAINSLISDLNAYIDDVASSLKKYDAEAQRTRGTLYQAGDIPSKAEFKTAFNVKIELLPIPMEDDFRVDYITNTTKKELKANNKIRFDRQTQHLISLAQDPLLRLQTSMANLERSPKIHGTTIDGLNWWCDNIDSLLVDRKHEKLFKKLANRIQREVTNGYDPESKPKYDPEAIEGALSCIKEVFEEFECIKI